MSVYTQNPYRGIGGEPLKQSAASLVFAMLAIDFFFIGFDFLLLLQRWLGVLVLEGRFNYLSVSYEGGVPEFFNYSKLLFVSLILLSIFISTRKSVYLVLSMIFCFALIDDAFMLHERASWAFSGFSLLPDAWRQGNHAQLLYFATLAAAFALLLLGAWSRAGMPHRRYAAAMIASLCALAFFAVIVDFIHALVGRDSPMADRGLDIIEDGGEMLAVTLACWVALVIHANIKRAAV